MIASLKQLSAIPSLMNSRRHAAREEIVAYQNRQLRRLIIHAYENVPYYRRLFDLHGVKPAQVRTTADLASLPITSKRDLKMLPDNEVVARGINASSLIPRVTSGSSGEPLTVRRTWSEERVLNFFRRRAMSDYGLRARDKIAHVTIKRSLDSRDNQLALRIFQAAGYHRRTVIDCLLPAEEIIRGLREFQPDAVVGYAGVMAQISQSLTPEDRRTIRPRFVVAGAEVLSAQMREKIEAAFGVPVYDVYGSHEFNLVAWQCQATGAFHTCDDGVIVEVLKDGRPAHAGETGEVIATGLHSFAMPFIRYRLGDIVRQGDEVCRCGQPFSTIESIQGRQHDYFPLPGRRSIHPLEIWAVMRRATDWISVFQLVQERLGRFVLQLVTCRSPLEGELATLGAAIRASLGLDVELEIRIVREIPNEPTGKMRAFRSQVGSAPEQSSPSASAHEIRR